MERIYSERTHIKHRTRECTINRHCTINIIINRECTINTWQSRERIITISQSNSRPTVSLSSDDGDFGDRGLGVGVEELGLEMEFLSIFWKFWDLNLKFDFWIWKNFDLRFGVLNSIWFEFEIWIQFNSRFEIRIRIRIWVWDSRFEIWLSCKYNVNFTRFFSLLKNNH
jgi:hypothetical protein